MLMIYSENKGLRSQCFLTLSKWLQTKKHCSINKLVLYANNKILARLSVSVKYGKD